MPPSSSAIRKTIRTYLDRHPEERDALAGLFAVCEQPVDVTARTMLPGHVTCSAVVVDRRRRVLHIRHRATQGLVLAPGGHVEPEDRTLLDAALRELSEEAGIPPGALCLTPQLLGSPIDIDVHDIAADPLKDEPAHRHYDFRYVFYLSGEEPPTIAPQDEEVSGAQWLAFSEVTSPTLRAKLLRTRLDGQPEPVNASALIHDGAGRYLLHLRDHKPGVIWQSGAFALLGGGRAHDDQDLEDTLLRELSEEAPGLRLEDVEPYAVEEATSVDGLRVPIQVFAGRWRGNPDRLRLYEGVLLHWFTSDELDRLRLSPATRDLIHRHTAENPPGDKEDVVPAVWGGGSRTVLNGIGVHLHLEDADGRVLLGLRHPDSKYAGDTWHGVRRPALLDLGAGTGQVPAALLPVLPRLARLDLVDADRDMLHQADLFLRPLLAGRAAAFHPVPAEEFTAPEEGYRADLVTCARAFHWMDRPAVLAVADRVTSPGAALAIMGDGSLWTHRAPWTTALRELIQSHLGAERRAGTTGAYSGPDRRYEDDLADSPFSDLEEHRFPLRRTWTPDMVVGYLRSTSFARPALFGDRHPRFEAEARALLEQHAAKEGGLVEDTVFDVLLARRPGGAR
ncbi:NUDIX domain-containing protein [Streptomyces sp. NPDC058861]|uniref:NUDIX domain-containing protein n=1 Tax=Streptomyces sp. NPDC058861 TaxID=3346653 RepID=UPI0036B0F8CF